MEDDLHDAMGDSAKTCEHLNEQAPYTIGDFSSNEEVNFRAVKVESMEFDVETQGCRQEYVDNQYRVGKVKMMLALEVRTITMKQPLSLEFQCGFCSLMLCDLGAMNIHLYEHCNIEDTYILEKHNTKQRSTKIARPETSQFTGYTEEEVVSAYDNSDDDSTEELDSTMHSDDQTMCGSNLQSDPKVLCGRDEHGNNLTINENTKNANQSKHTNKNRRQTRKCLNSELEHNKRNNEYIKPNTFQCDVCLEVFTQYASLRFHSKIHSQPFECNLCGISFDRRSKVDEHMNKQHGTIFSCLICKQEFDNQTKLKVHVERVHESRRGYVCGVCGKHINDKSNLRKHMRRKHAANVKKSTDCTLDGKQVNKADDSIECTLDEKQTAKADDSANSKRTGDRVVLECEVCLKVFTKSASLRVHSYIHLENKPHACNICGSSFARRYKLDEHMNRHRGTKFPCQMCKKEFDSNVKLKMHIGTVHEKSKCFVCSVCGKQISDKSNLRKHVRRKHTANSEKPTHFECEVCLKVFTKSSMLKIHSYAHQNIKPHLCNVCGASFAKRYTLDAHMNQHLGKRFPCDLCEKEFDNQTKLKTHVEGVHERSRSCVCTVCGMQITDKSNLRKHLRRRHPGHADLCNRDVICQICAATFKTQKQLDTHVEFRHSHIVKQDMRAFDNTITKLADVNDLAACEMPSLQGHTLFKETEMNNRASTNDEQERRKEFKEVDV